MCVIVNIYMAEPGIKWTVNYILLFRLDRDIILLYYMESHYHESTLQYIEFTVE